ncbi:MAG: cation transporter [Candidatus Brocadiaceae bacterium]|nr:cation transporter [Candidatus Brocadiaceae bacterium]
MVVISSAEYTKKAHLYQWALTLALITILYNVAEGIVSVLFGMKDEALSLFGFGIDSFVEVISGVGVWHMVRRFMKKGEADASRFELQALRITGTAFYILVFGLVVTSAISIFKGHKPETTFWGIVVALVSILSMWTLIHYKIKVGNRLNSQAILADANCTKACLCLSVVLLLTSVGYEFTGIGGMDAVGTMIIAALSFKEGRESFRKAQGVKCSCHFER